MKGINLVFRNRPNEDGTVSTFTVNDCMVAPKGSPDDRRKKLTIHLPKSNSVDVDGAWINYGGDDYHVVGVSSPLIEENTPGRWNRYAIAEMPF